MEKKSIYEIGSVIQYYLIFYFNSLNHLKSLGHSSTIDTFYKSMGYLLKLKIKSGEKG